VTGSDEGYPRNTASDSDWLRVTTGQYGHGSATIEYTVAPNTSGAARSGKLTVGDRTFTGNQPAKETNGAPAQGGDQCSRG
jgi:hypothetical protein